MAKLEFPNEAFDYMEKNGLVQKFIRYVIDRRYRKSVLLCRWLNDLVVTESDLLDEAADEIKLWLRDNASYDEIVYRCFVWVKQNIKYVSDKSTWDVIEKWQTAEETLDLETGDCEDGAILIYVLARYLGVPSNRMLLMCGDVEGGGHCWLAYKPMNNPATLLFLDWCYWYDRRNISNRPQWYVVDNKIVRSIFCKKKDYRQDKYYKMWWAFDENNSYSDFKLTV